MSTECVAKTSPNLKSLDIFYAHTLLLALIPIPSIQKPEYTMS